MDVSVNSEGVSDRQRDALFIVFGTSGLISMLGSSFLCYLIWNSTKSLSLSPRNRIIFGLSFFDFLASSRNCVTGFHDIHHQRTEPGPICTLTGYLNYLSASAPLYNLFLAVFYYFTICGGVSQKTFALKYEKWGHAVAILYSFLPGTVGLFFKIYNPAKGFRAGCVSDAYPYGCSGEECTRGQSAHVFLALIALAVYVIVLPGIIVTNLLIYWYVRGLEQRTRRFSLSDDKAAKTRRVATQCFLYVFVFFLTWIFTVIVLILELVKKVDFEANDNYYPLLVLNEFFYPLQGFGNLVVYLRPVYLQLQESAGCTRWEAFCHILFNKPAPTADGHSKATAMGISSTACDQGSQPMSSGLFRHISPRSSQQAGRDKTANSQVHTEEGTQEFTLELTLEMSKEEPTREALGIESIDRSEDMLSTN